MQTTPSDPEGTAGLHSDAPAPPVPDAGSATDAGATPASGAAMLPAPVRTAERIDSLDVLRGVAVLGILMMNIVAFGLPFASYASPKVAGGDTGLNIGIWFFNAVLFDGKMRAIFSMLFGAGVVLMADRALAKGITSGLAGVHYRRNLWLVLFGLVHAYILLWPGDILYGYGLCGMLLYRFRDTSAKRLIIAGVCVLAILTPIRFADLWNVSMLLEREASAIAIEAEGGTPTEEQAAATEALEMHRTFFSPTEEQVQEEIDTLRSGYGAIFVRLAGMSIIFQTAVFLLFLVWDVVGMMLLGMGMMKLGLFSAARTGRFYSGMVVIGYGIGIPLTIAIAWSINANGFDMLHFRRLQLLMDINRFSVAAGHIGVVMLICRSGVLPWLRARLAAVGRMALTNYIGQTVIGTLVFYGYGLGLYGHLQRYQLYFVVLGIWLVQLTVSPIWLRRFRFGPMEWLWRSLTYKTRQPMRIARY